MHRADFPNRLPDDEIIRRLRSGDEKLVNATMEYLRSKYRGLVADLVVRTGGNPGEDLDSVLDDALLVVLEKVRAGSFDPEKGSLSTWFFGIGKKKMQNQVRRRSHQFETEQEFQRSASLQLSPADKAMEDEEKRKVIAAAICKLDKSCQQILFEYWQEEKPLKDIAQSLGISNDAAKQRHHRCLQKLRDLLKNDYDDWF